MQLMALFALYLAGKDAHLGFWYGLGLAAGGIFFLYQQILIRRREPDQCFRAFLNNNYFGMIVFIGLALDYQFRA
jgi:4-hydroxybenzoate polyprenyltransferase